MYKVITVELGPNATKSVRYDILTNAICLHCSSTIHVIVLTMSLFDYWAITSCRECNASYIHCEAVTTIKEVQRLIEYCSLCTL